MVRRKEAGEWEIGKCNVLGGLGVAAGQGGMEEGCEMQWEGCSI